jgi:hypothetical protein
MNRIRGTTPERDVPNLGIVLPAWYQAEITQRALSMERMRRAGLAPSSARRPAAPREKPGPQRFVRRVGQPKVLDLRIVLPRWREADIDLPNAA